MKTHGLLAGAALALALMIPQASLAHSPQWNMHPFSHGGPHPGFHGGMANPHGGARYAGARSGGTVTKSSGTITNSAWAYTYTTTAVTRGNTTTYYSTLDYTNGQIGHLVQSVTANPNGSITSISRQTGNGANLYVSETYTTATANGVTTETGSGVQIDHGVQENIQFTSTTNGSTVTSSQTATNAAGQTETYSTNGTISGNTETYSYYGTTFSGATYQGTQTNPVG